MKRTHHPLSAFSLVEVTLALGVAAFSLVAIFGLLPIALNSNQSAIEQTAAASLTMTVVADLRAVPSGATTTSPKFGFSIPTSGAAASTPQTIYLRQDGSPTAGKTTGDAPVAGESHYRVTLGFISPPNINQKKQMTATMVRILVTWPSMADPDPTKWPARFAGSYETVTVLGQN